MTKREKKQAKIINIKNWVEEKFYHWSIFPLKTCKMSIKKTIENLQIFNNKKTYDSHRKLAKEKVINLQTSSSSPDNQIRKSKKKPEILKKICKQTRQIRRDKI
ncbi:unnamed protein product [Prunus armeniaca]